MWGEALEDEDVRQGPDQISIEQNLFARVWGYLMASRAEDIEDDCIANHHAVRYALVEDRAYPIICSECRLKIQAIGE